MFLSLLGEATFIYDCNKKKIYFFMKTSLFMYFSSDVATAIDLPVFFLILLLNKLIWLLD